MTQQEPIATILHDMILQARKSGAKKPPSIFQPDPEWKKLKMVGTRLWLDTGDIEAAARLWNSEFEALTTNNTLLNTEIQKGIYDRQIHDVARELKKAMPDLAGKTLLLEIAFYLNAWHALRLVDQFNAFVSVELHTDLAHDVQKTVEYGRRYYAICPDHFYIKVPFTAAGLLGARKLGALGIPVNFTLGFSARQNYLTALIARPKFVNVFLGRLNAFVADNKLGNGVNVGEKATLATQREILKLRTAGRTSSLLIAASMREGKQVTSLAGVDVFTMPPKVAEQYRAQPASAVASQVQNDPAVTWNAGISQEDCNGASLWEVPARFKECVDALLRKDIEKLNPADIPAQFADAGLGDLFPDWSEADLKVISADGKIPVFAKWKDRLSSGRIGLDTLTNISALLAFTKDQQALDDRIKSLMV